MSADATLSIKSALGECARACLAFEAFHAEILALCAADTGVDEMMMLEPKNSALLDRVAAAGKAMRLALASVPQ